MALCAGSDSGLGVGTGDGGSVSGGAKEERTAARQELVPKALMYSCWEMWMDCRMVWPR